MAISVEDVVALCEHYYGADADLRCRANAILHESVLPDLQMLMQTLQAASSTYALTFASLGVVRWLRTNAAEVAVETRAAVLREVLASAKRCFDENRPRFVTAILMGCASRIGKMSFEKEPFVDEPVRQAISAIASTEASMPNKIFAAWQLSSLVHEVSLFDSTKSASYLSFGVHRRCSNNFRDTHLLDVFTQSVMALQRTVVEGPPTASAALVTELVKVVRNCLSFDFMAIIVEESEDAMAAQFPASWNNTLTTGGGFATLWRLLASLPPPWSTEVMQAMGAVCGARRTFFDNVADKEAHLDMALRAIASQPMINDERMASSEFVAALTEASIRFITPYGYRDLYRVPSFEAWLRCMHGLTRAALNIPFGESGSMHTVTLLLQFWGRMVSSKRLAMTDDPPVDIEPLTLDILSTFIAARLGGTAGDVEDDSTDVMQQQCDVIPSMVLVRQEDGLGAVAHHVLANTASLAHPACLTWMFHLAAALMRGVYAIIDEAVVPAATAFLGTVVRCCQNAASAGSGGSVEAAMVSFLVALQSALGMSRVTSLQLVIQNVFGDKSGMFQFILQHIGHNLIRPLDTIGGNVDVVSLIRASVELTVDTCREMPPALLATVNLQLPPMSELPLSRSVETYKLRTSMMLALYLLRCGGGGTPVQEGVMELLGSISSQIDATNPQDPTLAFVGGWLRDLRGVIRGAATQSTSMAWVVEWILHRAETLLQLASTPNLHSGIVDSLLRVVVEVVTPTNRNAKVNFPSSNHSALGLSYFKFVCAIVQRVVGSHVTFERLFNLQQNSAAGDTQYAAVLKPMMLCMDAIRKAIETDAVPLGAMAFYKDDTHDVTIAGLLRYLIHAPYDTCRSYQKFVASAMKLLKTLTEGGVLSPFAALQSGDLHAVVGWCLSVVSDVETPTNTLVNALGCLSFFGGMVSVAKTILEGNASGTPPATPPLRPQGGGVAGSTADSVNMVLARMLAEDPSVWVRIVNACMSVVILQDRALSLCTQIVFPIFSIDGAFWNAFVRELMEGYPANRHARVARAVEDLGAAAESQEKFFGEVITFRSAMRNI